MSIPNLDRRVDLQQFSSGAWVTRHTVSARREWRDPAAEPSAIYQIRYPDTPLPERAWRLVDGTVFWYVAGVAEGQRRKADLRLLVNERPSYADLHAQLLAELAQDGAAVTFTKRIQAEAAATGELVETTLTVTGYAKKIAGDPVVYERLSLVEKEAPTLLFAATTFGPIPPLGGRCTWAVQGFVAKEVLPDAPAGTAISSKVVIANG